MRAYFKINLDASDWKGKKGFDAVKIYNQIKKSLLESYGKVNVLSKTEDEFSILYVE